MPLQNVRGNFARIHSALSELLGLSERTNEAGGDGKQLDLAAVELAVHDAVAMFQRQAQGLLQVCEPLDRSCLLSVFTTLLLLHIVFY